MNKNNAPTEAEWGKLRAFLAQNGISQADIEMAIGGNIGGRTRAEIVSQLKAWLKTRSFEQ